FDHGTDGLETGVTQFRNILERLLKVVSGIGVDVPRKSRDADLNLFRRLRSKNRKRNCPQTDRYDPGEIPPIDCLFHRFSPISAVPVWAVPVWAEPVWRWVL